jgi:signal transduction histidine kinase
MSLSQELEIAIFRITQEALSNTKKYSFAAKVDVSLCYTRKYIVLAICDNGRGFKLPERLSDLANYGKLGIIGMEEKVRLYGGSFSISSQLKKGTKIKVKLPVFTNIKGGSSSSV